MAGATITEHDLRQPDEILAAPELRALIDFEQPVALLLVAILHFIPDDDDPGGIIGKLLEPFPSGSYLVMSHGTADAAPEVNAAAEIYDQATSSAHVRSRDHILRLIEGLDLEEPGIVWLPQWRPDPGLEPPPNPAEAYFYALVARKP